MNRALRRTIAPMAMLAGLATASHAQKTVSSYDMLNGEYGSYTYHDDAYNGTGSTTTSLAYLSGGKGDLTDGITTPVNWFSTPGPYVGWYSIDPNIVFHFSGAGAFTRMRIHADDSNGAGGVFLPSIVTVGADDGMGGFVSASSFTFDDGPTGAPLWYEFDISGQGSLANTADVRIQLDRKYVGYYMMIDEIEFYDDNQTDAAPEPATLVLVGTGLVGVGIGARRRRKSAQALL